MVTCVSRVAFNVVAHDSSSLRNACESTLATRCRSRRYHKPQELVLCPLKPASNTHSEASVFMQAAGIFNNTSPAVLATVLASTGTSSTLKLTFPSAVSDFELPNYSFEPNSLTS